MKQCKCCGQQRSADEFRSRRDGDRLFFRTSECRQCEVDRIREWRHGRRFCQGCKNYRPREVFPVPGRGVRCDRCRQTPRHLTKDEYDARKRNA